MIYKFVVNTLFGLVCCAILIFTIWLTDKTAPSYAIAMWTIPHELVPGQTFTIKEIFVRNKLCWRHIDHGFSQDDIRTDIPTYGSHQMDSPPDLKYPAVYGLLSQSFDGTVPISLHHGEAVYVMRLAWSCWWNPITWVNPYTARLVYPVWIKDCETC